MVEYTDTLVQSYHENAFAVQIPTTYEADVLTIEYEKSPELINNQKTYQRIAFKAKADGDVYDLSAMNFSEAGIEFSSEYDGEFDSRLFTSINNKIEGEGGNFNEFYLNGEIGENAADLQKVKEGDIIEWRYAEESDGTCGGVPDLEQIKAMLEYGGTEKVSMDPYGIGLHMPGTPRSFYGTLNQALYA